MKTRALALAALAIVAAEPFLFWNAFAGDAQVHLVFMESASKGKFFEFNPGESVSGETSPGYMMLGAAFFRVMPAAAVPIALKFLNLVAWYAFCALVYRLAVRMLRDDDRPARAWPTVAALIAASLPGSVYNANAGMENGLFAAAIWGWLLLVERWNWLDGKVESHAKELAAASILGLSCWLRPEGAIVALAAFAFRLANARIAVRHWLPGALVVLGLGGGNIIFQYAFTGDLVATSMLSRRILAMPNFVRLGPVSWDPTFAQRLLIYAPLTALFIWGARSASGPARATERLLRVLLGAFFVTYSIAGTPQLARYLIFLMPILVVGAVRGARRIWRNPRGRIAVAVAALAIVALDLVESRHRLRQYSPALLRNATAAPARRTDRTDKLLAALENPTGRPVVVATEAVQIRYELDERIIVRSLDGRVDRTLLAFAQPDGVDHIGYLKAMRVDDLLQTVNYNRMPDAWSLAELRRLAPGETLRRDDLSFRRLKTAPYYAVTAP